MTDCSDSRDSSKIYIDNGIVIDKILESDNLNECVEYLLKKEKVCTQLVSTSHIKTVIKHNSLSNIKIKDKKRRLRKNKD
jgi:hypothetical protein